MNTRYLLIFSLIVLFYQVSFASSTAKDTLIGRQKVYTFDHLINTVPGQNKSVSLSDYKDNKGVIVIFMTNGCYHCIEYRDRIKALHTQFASQGFPVIAINPSNPTYAFEETYEEMVKNATKENYEFPYLQDPEQEITHQYGVKFTPEAFVLLKTKYDWILQYEGDIDNDLKNKKKNKITYVEDVVNALLNNQKVPAFAKPK